MLIATFGPATGWVGKTITYEDERFVLEGHGPIDAAGVLEYDRQGHLVWAYDGLREWVHEMAGEPPVETAAESPAETAAETPTRAAAAEAAGPGRRRWRPLIVAAVSLLVLLLVATLIAGGRPRDGLGIALTVLGVALVAVCVSAALKPEGPLRRWFPGLSAKRLLAVSGALAAACFIFAAALWWMPHYEVVVPADTRVVLDDAPAMDVKVVNHGLFGGFYEADYSVDGAAQPGVALQLGAGESRMVSLILPAGAEPGATTLALGGDQIATRVVRPPAYHVAALEVTPAVVKVGQTVAVETTVKNSGDIAGTFDGVLKGGGKELAASPIEVGPGEAETLSYTFKAGKAGRHPLSLGDAGKLLMVVKPVRLAGGHMIVRKVSGGRAKLSITNPNGADAMVVLARSSSPRSPVLAVYVRKGGKAAVTSIPDGQYTVWNSLGADWNWYTRDFLLSAERVRWRVPLRFATTSSTNYWTNSWSDSSYRYTQRYSQTTVHYSGWKLTLGSGQSKYTKVVTAGGFPRM